MLILYLKLIKLKTNNPHHIQTVNLVHCPQLKGKYGKINTYPILYTQFVAKQFVIKDLTYFNRFVKLFL